MFFLFFLSLCNYRKCQQQSPQQLYTFELCAVIFSHPIGLSSPLQLRSFLGAYFKHSKYHRAKYHRPKMTSSKCYIMVQGIVEDFNESVPQGGHVTGNATLALRPYGVRVCVTAKTKRGVISQSWLRIEANENSCHLTEFILAQKNYFRRLDTLTVRGYTDTSSDEEKDIGSTTAKSTSTTSDEDDNDVTKVRNFTN
jgi:hypothetical protein